MQVTVIRIVTSVFICNNLTRSVKAGNYILLPGFPMEGSIDKGLFIKNKNPINRPILKFKALQILLKNIRIPSFSV